MLLILFIGVISACSQTGSATQAHTNVGKAALEYLSLLKRGDANEAATRNFDSTLAFARRAQGRPSFVLPKIWAEEIVPQFLKQIEGSEVGILLVDSPAITLIETRSLGIQAPSRFDGDGSEYEMEDAYLELTYSSPDASPLIDRGKLLKKSGITVRFARNAYGKPLLVTWVGHIPEMDEIWHVPNRVLGCRIRPGFCECLTTTIDKGGTGAACATGVVLLDELCREVRQVRAHRAGPQTEKNPLLNKEGFEHQVSYQRKLAVAAG